MSNPRAVPLLSPSSFSSQYSSGDNGAASGSSSVSYEPPHVQSISVLPADDPAQAAASDEDEDAQLTFPAMIVMPGPWQWLFFILVGIFAALAFTVLRDPLEKHGVTSSDILRYGSIPLVSIAFTYGHIWLALWMTFYPLEYFGICQVRENQRMGLIPSRSSFLPFKK